jgi:dihydrolipoamide dehydrogenase
MIPAKEYDLAVIGAGPGGYAAALYASRKKLRVCVIEKADVGGTCLNRGCIPTKALVNSASVLSTIRNAPVFGIDVNGYSLNYPKVLARKNEVVSRLRTGIETLFRAGNIDLARGHAKLLGPKTVDIDHELLVHPQHIIIAVGSKVSGLPGIKIDEKDVLSSDGILEMTELPKSIAIIGGGVIGCEFANLFNAFGVKVTVVELTDRIVPGQSREASKKLETALKKSGVEVITSANVESLKKSGGSMNVCMSGQKTVGAEKVLVSVGRRPATDELDLEHYGVKTENGRIVVDENLRTSVQNIFAIGDCVAGPLLAHRASYDGMLACDNILGDARKADYSNCPSCVWTEPEVASVGLTEEEAKAKHPDCKVAKFPYLGSGKAYLLGRQEGYAKIIGDPGGRILGVEIFGYGACELIAEAVLAKTAGINIKDWAQAIHGHPTLSEILQEAAQGL